MNRVRLELPVTQFGWHSLKYRPGYPDQPFTSLAAAQSWVDDFVRWYNEDHQHSGIRFVTPAQRHDGHEHAILANRARVYAAARARKPNRWARTIRNWSPVAVVRLNPRPAAAKGAAPATSPAASNCPSGQAHYAATW